MFCSSNETESKDNHRVSTISPLTHPLHINYGINIKYELLKAHCARILFRHVQHVYFSISSKLADEGHRGQISWLDGLKEKAKS
jgi:hypothetical protein